MSPVLKTWSDLRLKTGRSPLWLTTASFIRLKKTNWNAIQLVMSPHLRLISWWCLQGLLQINCCVLLLTRRKSGPIETALSGHASAVLGVLTKETLCVAWLNIIYFISTSSQSKVDECTRAKLLPNFTHGSPCIKSMKAPCLSRWSKWGTTHCLPPLRRSCFCEVMTHE